MRFADILRDIWNAFLQARSGRPNPILLPMVADALAAVLSCDAGYCERVITNHDELMSNYPRLGFPSEHLRAKK